MEGEVAQRVQIILEDDYDGGEADETVSFALDGAEYEIDLSSANATELRNALAPWLSHARKVGGRRRSRGVAGKAPAADSAGATSDIRAWALDNGMEVSSRGRISSEVRSAYEQAHA
jgi:nucleoid-associated protein Lsr2